jgi:hypothetical protein
VCISLNWASWFHNFIIKLLNFLKKPWVIKIKPLNLLFARERRCPGLALCLQPLATRFWRTSSYFLSPPVLVSPRTFFKFIYFVIIVIIIIIITIIIIILNQLYSTLIFKVCWSIIFCRFRTQSYTWLAQFERSVSTSSYGTLHLFFLIAPPLYTHLSSFACFTIAVVIIMIIAIYCYYYSYLLLLLLFLLFLYFYKISRVVILRLRWVFCLS